MGVVVVYIPLPLTKKALEFMSGDDSKNPLVDEMVNGKGKDLSHLPQIAWGINHEKDPIKAFMSDTATQHEGGLHGFRQCGLFVKSGYPYLAGSPDGLFQCKCCSPATIEVKCPYSVKDAAILKKDVYTRV